MIFSSHVQHIGNELVNIINKYSLQSKIQSTFVSVLAPFQLPKSPQTLIHLSPMSTGNSHYRFSAKPFSLLLLLVACFAWQPTIAQQPAQSDPLSPLYKLKKVKSITAWQQGAQPEDKIKVYFREYNSNGNLTFELVYDEAGEVIKKYQSFYAANGKLTKEVWTQDETDSVTYKYKADKLTEESWYWGADKSRTRVVHFFDSLDRKVCTVSKNNWGVYVDSFFYENGQMVLIKNFNENGQLTSLTENTYDAKGRLTQGILKDEDGNVLQTNKKIFTELGMKSLETISYSTPTVSSQAKITASMAETFKYDSQKQLKEITNNSYTNNELLENNKVIFIYNDKGLPASKTIQNLANNTKQSLRFAYTFF